MRTSHWISSFVFANCLLAVTACAQSSITLAVDTTSHGYAIPTDFSGLGFERGTETSGNAGVSGYFFSPQNTQLVTLFQNLSIKNLRVGGGSVDDEIPAGTGSDGYTGVDDLFQFAQAAGANMIYSLRLLNAASDPIPNLQADDVAIAQHIVQNFSPAPESFAIGNEPDFHSYHTYCTAAGCTCTYPTGCTGTSSNLHIEDPSIYETVPIGSTTTAGTAYPSYLADWRSFETAIAAAIPAGAAKFSAPDTGAYSTLTNYNGESWTQLMADNEKSSGIFANATQHIYVGGSPGTTTAQQAIDNMLSTEWVTGTQIATGPEGLSTYTPYHWLYTNNLAPVAADGVPYRLTESDDYLTGVNGASNSFASALWALDYMHWWAGHGAAGVNFHNKQWIYTDTIVPDPNPCVTTCGNYQTAPKGYGIKAFDLGGHGYVEPVSVTNSDGINVTAYAVGEARDLYLTIVNKTHATTQDATTADITVQPQGFAAASVSLMMLTDGSPGDPSSTMATLGGATIANNARWLGIWTPLAPETGGNVTVTVPASTAVVVKIHAASAYAGPIQINQNGALETFAIDRSGNIWHDWQLAADVPNSSSSNWSGWTDNLSGALSRGGTAVAKNLNNTLEVFIPSTTGDVYANWQLTPDGAWSGWSDLGGTGISSLRAGNNADGSLSVFGIGANGDLWYDSQSAPGVGWSGWIDLAGENIQPGFVVGQNLNGELEVFGVDRQLNLWTNSQTTSGSWSGWSPLPGAQVNPRLAVARNLDGRLEIFGVDPRGAVWTNSQTNTSGPGSAWSGWSEIPGQQLRPGFVVGQNADGRLAVFGVRGRGPQAWDGERDLEQSGSGAGVWSALQQTPGGSWGAWTDMGGAYIHPPLVVSNTADGRIQLFGARDNGDVWSDWQTTGGDWNGWADFGGKGISF